MKSFTDEPSSCRLCPRWVAYEQHLVHDFHDLAGAAPGLLLTRIGDARPPAMALPQAEPENLFA
jgi:hypothetical protein